MKKRNKPTSSQYVWEKFFPNFDLRFLFATLNENIVDFHNNTTLSSWMVFRLYGRRNVHAHYSQRVSFVWWNFNISYYWSLDSIQWWIGLLFTRTRFCKLSLCTVLNLTFNGKNPGLHLVYLTYFLTNNFIKPLFVILHLLYYLLNYIKNLRLNFIKTK